jgi:hypothetical protein
LYEEEYDRFLDDQIGFPLVKDRTTKQVRVEDLAAIREQLRALAGDGAAFDAMGQDRTSRPAMVKNRVNAAIPRLEAIINSLLDAEGLVAKVRVNCPGAREQQDAVARVTSNFMTGAAFSAWRYLGAGLRDRPMLADNERDIGNFNVSTRDLELYFYRDADSSSPDGEALRPLEGWQLLTRILDSAREPKRSEDGKQWRVLYSRRDEQANERFFALIFQFPRALPEVDRWPTFAQLKRK